MRRFVTLATAAAVTMFATALAADSFTNYGSVSTATKGTVTVDGKVAAGWYVNTVYPIKLRCGNVKLGKADAKFVDEMAGGKAKKALFKTDATGSCEIKAVFCDEKTCTSPLKYEFSI